MTRRGIDWEGWLLVVVAVVVMLLFCYIWNQVFECMANEACYRGTVR